jgi:fatty acid desaturase
VFKFLPLFRYSRWDALLALSGAAIVALLFGSFVLFDDLPWWAIGLAFIAAAWSYCWNLQCISHNFIHNPFFTNVWLNRAFGVLETLALGVPHLLYHHYHMNHHWGDNDIKGSNGTTKDWSSIYRHSKDDEPEPFWRYVLLSFWRVEVGPVLGVVKNHGLEHIVQLAVETAALGAFWIVMVAVNWRFFLLFYLPSYYIGWMLSYAEGYLEHYDAQPGNPYANSVSSYHRAYNLLWFNNGYHQEHHWDPKMHWTLMRRLHEQIKDRLKANGTRILRGPHLTAFFEEWIDRWAEQSVESAQGNKISKADPKQTQKCKAA